MEMHPEPPPGSIFVFGSNLVGIHGKGAALTAKKRYGAVQGKGEGMQGQSYGIPTKGLGVNGRLNTLPLWEIEWHVTRFLIEAKRHHELTFFVTRIGCGLAGYRDDQIAPFFADAPANCLLPDGWRYQ